MVFDSIYIIGNGSICINISEMLIHMGLKPRIIVYNEHMYSFLKHYAENKELFFIESNKHTDIEKFFVNIAEKSLIISANNMFLFSEQIINKENLKIINFHNALLPAHKGVNAPTWSIFEQDDFSGITWHIVNKELDSGDIIIQKQISLNGTETALELAKQLMQLAHIAFEEILVPLLNWTLQSTKMPILDKAQIHLQKDMPNNGILDLTWNENKISAFLRSLDWGIVQQLPMACVVYKNEKLWIKSYRIEENIYKHNMQKDNNIQHIENKLIIQKANKRIELQLEKSKETLTI